MKRRNAYLLLLFFFSLGYRTVYAQIDVIEIDTITRAAVRTAPFDKPFLIKAQIETEEVKRVSIIPKIGYKTLDQTIAYYIKKNNGSYTVPQMEENYFWTRKIGDKNFLFISIADDYLFKPSKAYFIIPDYKQTDATVVSFFDLYYQASLGGSGAAANLARAEESLAAFETKMRKIYGPLDFGFMTSTDFVTNRRGFDSAFTKNLLVVYQRYQLSKTNFNNGLPARLTTLTTNLPSFDSLTYHQLNLDTSVNKEAVAYLTGKQYTKNDAVSDFSTINQTTQTSQILSGVLGLHCITCEKADASSDAPKDIAKRTTNLDSSIKQLLLLQRALYLLTPKNTAPRRPTGNIATSISRINTWVEQLQQSKDSLNLLIKQRKKIENTIMDSIFVGKMFTYSQILAGNSYLNFETRNKLLLTPDFGIVTPSLFKAGKELEYGIIPYVGFHINLMAVDKDISYGSYKKSPLQYLSLMVGWSLVSMNKDSAYANFFEKSSFLTGVGYRLNNVIRVTGGLQWLFKLGVDDSKNPTRKLKPVPYVGLSFDLNIKQYLNGFVDLLSGIGKTKPAPPAVTTAVSNQQ